MQGEAIERFAQMTDWSYYEAARRFQRVLVASGINAALKARGVKVRAGGGLLHGGELLLLPLLLLPPSACTLSRRRRRCRPLTGLPPASHASLPCRRATPW